MIARLGVVTGLRAEAKIARSMTADARAGGGSPEGARVAAEALAAAGVHALMSFGLAGGLDPAFSAGALVVPERVVSASGVWQVEPALADLCGGTTCGALFAGQQIAATLDDKAALHRLTGATAIDLESGEVAAVAARHGLPFVVLRTVCDPAGRDLPPAALAALDGAGIIGVWRVLGSLARRPGQVPGLMALSRDALLARRALTAAAAVVGLKRKEGLLF